MPSYDGKGTTIMLATFSGRRFAKKALWGSLLLPWVVFSMIWGVEELDITFFPSLQSGLFSWSWLILFWQNQWLLHIGVEGFMWSVGYAILGFWFYLWGFFSSVCCIYLLIWRLYVISWLCLFLIMFLIACASIQLLSCYFLFMNFR